MIATASVSSSNQPSPAGSALEESVNVVTVKVQEKVGLNRTIQVARRFGVAGADEDYRHGRIRYVEDGVLTLNSASVPGDRRLMITQNFRN